MSLPDPDAIHPIAGLSRVVFLKPLLASPGEDAPANVQVGAFTQYDDPDHARAVFARNPACILRAIPLLLRGGVAELEAFAATG